jgi:glycosyltransferase involved in cell wall biosynthesis
MACGVPVLGAAVGGLLDTVVDGVTGVLVPARRSDLLAGGLARLLGDAAFRARLGAAGAQRARCEYGWDGVAAATLAAYRELASVRRKPVSVRTRRAVAAGAPRAQATGG